MTILLQSLERDGYAILPGVLVEDRVAALVSDLERALPQAGASLLESRGHVYGVRNLVEVWPSAHSVASEIARRAGMAELLGPGFGLVRSIFFDKPPGRSWSLPWHRDMTIAVRAGRANAEGFIRPTVKAGVPHVEAPARLLRRMLTARIALDDVTDDNGPLLVVPGTHDDADVDHLPGAALLRSRAWAVHMRAGDVLLIRPLVVHRSGASRKGTPLHRRTLHFEFGPECLLPPALEWHSFLRPLQTK